MGAGGQGAPQAGVFGRMIDVRSTTGSDGMCKVLRSTRTPSNATPFTLVKCSGTVKTCAAKPGPTKAVRARCRWAADRRSSSRRFGVCGAQVASGRSGATRVAALPGVVEIAEHGEERLGVCPVTGAATLLGVCGAAGCEAGSRLGASRTGLSGATGPRGGRAGGRTSVFAGFLVTEALVGVLVLAAGLSGAVQGWGRVAVVGLGPVCGNRAARRARCSAASAWAASAGVRGCGACCWADVSTAALSSASVSPFAFTAAVSSTAFSAAAVNAAAFFAACVLTGAFPFSPISSAAFSSAAAFTAALSPSALSA
mmetsp:Transcript_81192/g.216979  ORF Transcript_81192/g.216979 Transcript_81192/m.216979 type:complete len:312 (-) Transcript_81192:372-1307(-)